MVGKSLWDGFREVGWLKECLVATETMLGATDGEAANVRVAIAATHTELVGELIFFGSFAELLFALILTLRISQRHRSN